MNSITKEARSRFSSNASTIKEPSSPGADFRRPTLPTITPPTQHDFGVNSPLLAFDINWSAPPSPHSFHSPSTCHLASEYMGEREHHDYRSFPTMASISNEEGLFYPLERQHAQPPSCIDQVRGYVGPVMYNSDETTPAADMREKPIKKVTRGVSTVGRHARQLSGELVRRSSKFLSFNKAPNLIRRKHRGQMDEDMHSLASRQVDLGREVTEDDEPSEWREAIEADFRIVQWSSSIQI